MPNATPGLDTLFTEALERPAPADRAAYLDSACGPDGALRRRVEALVAAHFRADGDFLEHPAHGHDSNATTAHVPGRAPAPGPELGTAIGPYTLREQIGEGGMGVVYVAEQARPVRRKVALKLIKPGMDSRQVVARFEAERQALALMDHPNIATVLDAGTTTEGRPYFVMELVKGEPITAHCDRHRLTLRERLELFLQVCAAVQHAHQKGVIHRDIKPSNVMVTVHDVAAVAKVIDFGVAKAVGRPLTDHTAYTAVAQMIGTPLYMSPEQAGLSGLDVDTRTDVYALGVLLYELLTGTTPFDGDRLRAVGLDEFRRVIREEEPARPSARLSTLAAAARTTVADRRGADPRKLAHQVRGELDWVVIKCLEKDRNRRYESPGDLAADVRRYLADEPIQARPPSAGYRLRKFARRHRAGLATAGVVAAALVAGVAVSTWQAAEATRARAFADVRLESERKARGDADDERRRADDNYRRARAAVRQMLTQVAEDKIGAIPGMREVRRTLLEDAVAFYAELIRWNPGDPDAHAERADVFFMLGRYDEAIADCRRAIDLRPDDAAPHSRLAIVLSSRLDIQNRDYETALAHVRRAAELAPADPDHLYQVAILSQRLRRTTETRKALAEFTARAPGPETVYTAQRLAYLYSGFMLDDPIAALPHARTHVELEPTSPDAHGRLATVLRELGRYGESLEAWDLALRLTRKPNAVGSAYTHEGRGQTLIPMGRYAEAAADLDRAVALAPSRAYSYRLRGLARLHLKEYELALADMTRAAELDPTPESGLSVSPPPALVEACPHKWFRQGLLDLATRTVARSNGAPEAFAARASLYSAMGDEVKAHDDLAKAIEGFQRRLAGKEGEPSYDDASKDLAGLKAQLGLTLLKLARYTEAEPVLRECMKIREEQLRDHWLRFNAMSLLGEAMLGQKKYAEAEPLLLDGYDGMKLRQTKIPPAGSTRLPEAAGRLVRLYEATDRRQLAMEWRQKLPREIAPAPRPLP